MSGFGFLDAEGNSEGSEEGGGPDLPLLGSHLDLLGKPLREMDTVVAWRGGELRLCLIIALKWDRDVASVRLVPLRDRACRGQHVKDGCVFETLCRLVAQVGLRLGDSVVR